MYLWWNSPTLACRLFHLAFQDFLSTFSLTLFVQPLPLLDPCWRLELQLPFLVPRHCLCVSHYLAPGCHGDNLLPCAPLGWNHLPSDCPSFPPVTPFKITCLWWWRSVAQRNTTRIRSYKGFVKKKVLTRIFLAQHQIEQGIRKNKVKSSSYVPSSIYAPISC